MAKRKKTKLAPEVMASTPDLRDSFKTLLANIRFAAIDDPIKSITVVGTDVNEGKTMVSLNLASAIASGGQKVLIVEADMRKRSLANILNVHSKYGTYSILSGNCVPGEAIVATPIKNMYLLDCEPNIPSPPDVLSTKRFALLLDSLHEMFDFVIFDTPPLGAFVDGALISNLTDATILVVKQSKVKRVELVNSVKQLEAAKANLLGTVLTFSTDNQDNDYYYYSYYKHKKDTENSSNQEINKEYNRVSKDQKDKNLNAWLNIPSKGRAVSRRSAMEDSLYANVKVADDNIDNSIENNIQINNKANDKIVKDKITFEEYKNNIAAHAKQEKLQNTNKLFKKH